MLIWDQCSNPGLVGLSQDCIPSIYYGTMAPSHIRKRHCHYNGLHLWFSFRTCCKHANWRRYRELLGQICQRGRSNPRGKQWWTPGGGVKTFRYNYGIFSNTFYDFVSISIWAPVPWQWEKALISGCIHWKYMLQNIKTHHFEYSKTATSSWSSKIKLLKWKYQI